MDFKLEAAYTPTGDQPQAIKQLVSGLENQEKYQTLLGVTGSGKTFTVANVVEQINRPTLVLAHNKTLAAQLYAEFKAFFPHNAVEYFVSYYDYYQPEAYIPSSGVYIEKDLSINEDIERLRISTSSALLSGRRDVLVIASVSCKITKSMALTISETERRRNKQIAYNTANNIQPTQIKKKLDNALLENQGTSYSSIEASQAAEENLVYLSKPELEKRILAKRKDMEKAAKNLDFLAAAAFRDEITALKEKLAAKKNYIKPPAEELLVRLF